MFAFCVSQDCISATKLSANDRNRNDVRRFTGVCTRARKCSFPFPSYSTQYTGRSIHCQSLRFNQTFAASRTLTPYNCARERISFAPRRRDKRPRKHQFASRVRKSNAALCVPGEGNIPVNDVSQEVVVPQPVVNVHFLVVDRQGAGANTSLVLLGRMGAKFSREHLQDLLADPSTFRECREGEVIRIHLA